MNEVLKTNDELSNMVKYSNLYHLVCNVVSLTPDEAEVFSRRIILELSKVIVARELSNKDEYFFFEEKNRFKLDETFIGVEFTDKDRKELERVYKLVIYDCILPYLNALGYHYKLIATFIEKYGISIYSGTLNSISPDKKFLNELKKFFNKNKLK